MFQAIGLTKSYRRGRPPALLDLSFDARAGQVTALLGPVGSGRSTALLLALGLERGQGAALFDGRPYRRIKRPEREVGAVLAEQYRCPRHPGRRARAHLRMVAAASGVTDRRADQLLEQTRLAPAADDRLRTFSPGMNRRLALAEALLADPGTLLLDEPTHELSPKNAEWFHAVLRAFAAGGGTVLVALRNPQEAAVLADRVVTLEQGRLLGDQPVTEFLRTRLQDEVSVSGPQVGRLALAEALLADPGTLLLDEPTHELSPKNVEWYHAVLRAFAAGGGTVLVSVRSPQEAALLADRVVTLEQGRLLADQPVSEFLRTRLQDEVSVSGPQVGRLADLLTESGAQVRRESGTRIAVSGATRTEIGELAYRHGVLLHELTDHVVTRPGPARPTTAATAPAVQPAAPPPQPATPPPAPPPPATPPPATPPPATQPPPAPVGASALAADPGETVVVLSPGTAVTASVLSLPPLVSQQAGRGRFADPAGGDA